MIALLLACAPEYHLDPSRDPATQWVEVSPCYGRSLELLPLVEGAEPLAVWWCAEAVCLGQPYEVDGHLITECPAAGELRILWEEL